MTKNEMEMQYVVYGFRVKEGIWAVAELGFCAARMEKVKEHKAGFASPWCRVRKLGPKGPIYGPIYGPRGHIMAQWGV